MGEDVGASEWSYSVAYQPDVAAALNQLRQEVYDRGEYHRAEDLDPRYALTEAEFVATLEPDRGDGVHEFLIEDWRDAQDDGRAALARSSPTDPDSLLASQPESGTHSIIDMCGVSAKPAAMTVSPLTDEQSLTFFGTLTPTTDQVVEWRETFDPSAIRERWQGISVVSYVEGRPDQIHFTGFSGD